MTGPEALLRKALPWAIKAIRALAKPATQDCLVCALKHYPQVPTLTRNERC